jgi:hypothetical protein
MVRQDALTWNITTNASDLGCIQNDSNCTLTITAIDKAGNINDTETMDLVIDDIFPSINFTENSTADGIYYNNNYLYIEISYNETNPQNITYYLYNYTDHSELVSEINLSYLNTSYNFTGLSENVLYYYNVSIIDKVEHLNFTSTRNITIDTQAPIVTNISVNDSDLIVMKRSLLEINVTVNDSNILSVNISNMTSLSMVQQDDLTWNITVNASDLGCTQNDSNCTLTIIAIDKAGNINNTETLDLIIDDIFPTINFTNGTEPDDTYFNRDHIFINITFNETNPQNITYYLYNYTTDQNFTLVSNITYGPLNTSHNFTSLDSNMVYSYNVSLIDLVGHINHTLSRNITLDSTNPFVLSMASIIVTFRVIVVDFLII